jgi:hypothetical protein
VRRRKGCDEREDPDRDVATLGCHVRATVQRFGNDAVNEPQNASDVALGRLTGCDVSFTSDAVPARRRPESGSRSCRRVRPRATAPG